jgi:uncharacterized membrane protein
LTKLLTIDRLKTFSDSVLLVAITILAYNLSPPSLINGKLSGVELQSFLDNVYGLISSFSAISVFWLLYTKILDYMKEVDDVVILLSLIFFILVLLIPVFSLAQFQYRNLQSVISLALLQIINGLILLSVWTYIIKHRKKLMIEGGLNTSDDRYMYSRLVIIPSIYLVTIAIAFFLSIYLALSIQVRLVRILLSKMSCTVFCSVSCDYRL